jgi:peptidoglycan/xylan/chitin deacetylase (PgdA/CDA1 family)
MFDVSLGIDVEPDCPPYLATQYRGIVEGLPRLLDLLDEQAVRTTCFCTGEVAERFPERIRELIRRGHELGCHGHTHRRFDTLDAADADEELSRSTTVMRGFGVPVTAFRAPNLRFPDRYVPLLERHGFRVDSSQARYKLAYYRRRATTTSVTRIPASTTSSVLRLPRAIRDPWLAMLSPPVVLFVHPWEFVDLRQTKLRLDCRFRTGAQALDALGTAIDALRARGARFRRMDELAQQHRTGR